MSIFYLIVTIFALIIVLGVFIGIASYIISNQRAEILRLKLDNQTYSSRTKLLNSSERFLYKLLEESTRNLPVFVFAQVDLASIINVTSEAVDYYEALRDLDKSIDFLIVEKETTKPLLAIELNGPTHDQASRKTRDKFIERLFSDCEITLLVLRPYDLENKEKVVQMVMEKIKVNHETNQESVS